MSLGVNVVCRVAFVGRFITGVFGATIGIKEKFADVLVPYPATPVESTCQYSLD